MTINPLDDLKLGMSVLPVQRFRDQEHRLFMAQIKNVSGQSLDEFAADSGQVQSGDAYVMNDIFTLLRHWQSLGQPSNSTAGIFAMCYDQVYSRIYIGGLFSELGGVAANNIAYYDLETKTIVAMGSGLNGAVYALAVDTAGLLYVGGAYTNAGGDANADKFCKYDPSTSTFSSVGTNWASQAGDVYAIACQGIDYVFIGGSFLNLGGNANRDYFIRLNVSAAIYNTFPALLNNVVRAITVDSSGNVYIGGDFTNVNSVADADKICKITNYLTPTVTALGSAFSGATGNVYGLALDEGENLYIVGSFANIGDANGDGIVLWDKSSISSLGSGIGNAGLCVAVIDGVVYAGRSVAVAGEGGFRRWDGSAWDDCDGGLWGFPYAIVGDGEGNVYVGGASIVSDVALEKEMHTFVRYGYSTLREILNYLISNVYQKSAPLGCVLNASSFVPALSTYYAGLYKATLSATEAQQYCAIPRNGYLRNLYVVTYSAQPGTSPTHDMLVSVHINGAASGIFLTIPGGGGAGTYSDLTHVVSVSAGQHITFELMNYSTSASAFITSLSLEFV